MRGYRAYFVLTNGGSVPNVFLFLSDLSLLTFPVVSEPLISLNVFNPTGANGKRSRLMLKRAFLSTNYSFGLSKGFHSRKPKPLDMTQSLMYVGQKNVANERLL